MRMRKIKNFRLHIETCDIYAVEQWDDAELIGCCGPLVEDDLKDLNSYDYSDEKNEWLKENNKRLILWFPSKKKRLSDFTCRRYLEWD